MNTELLWMEEDELRGVCTALLARLCSFEALMVLVVNEAVRDAYGAGYSAAVIDVAQASEKRDANCYLLH